MDIDLLRKLWVAIPSPAKAFALAAAGTLFGAWIASRSQTKKSVVDELKALRTVHALCFSIINIAASFKRQSIGPMHAAYQAATEHHDQVMALGPPYQLQLQLDLRTLSKLHFPTATLERLLFEKTFVDGEAVATAVALLQSVHDLDKSIEFRNNLMADFKKTLPTEPRLRTAVYLGLVIDGVVDDRYRSNIEALHLQTDNCLFFARRLDELVCDYEASIRAKRRWQFRLPGVKLRRTDWSPAEAEGIFPAPAEYANWLRGFRKSPTRWARFRSMWNKGLGNPLGDRSPP